MLERHGVVTRGAVVSERTVGGFAAVYKVLSAFEDSGRCRRGYFVEGLGAAQFGTAGAVDRLRTFAELSTGSTDDDRLPSGKPDAVTLAATDPANPFGAALPWPERETSGGHRPGRKAGALVVLVDGALTLYVERGGKTLLTWTDDAALLGPAAAVALRGRSPRRPGPADGREGRRRADPRRRLHAPARGPRRRRVRRRRRGG